MAETETWDVSFSGAKWQKIDWSKPAMLDELRKSLKIQLNFR